MLQIFTMRKSRFVFSVLVAVLGVTLASDNVKRAPSGFQGVRGKKSIQDTYPDNVIPDTPDVALEKRIPSAGFHGMRGKKLYPERNDLPADLPKRAPMGFMGMRGKKEMEYVGEDLDKRAPMGFLGMRGKKEYDDDDEEYDPAAMLNNDFYMEKRAPMGFLGMRGKKEYAPYMEEEKRAPVNGFFGMRGKKQPGKSAFFGMRGKKFPYELRGKFVGVRGKKQSNENAIPEPEVTEDVNTAALTYQLTDLDLNELLLVLLEQQQQLQQLQDQRDAFGWQKRKGPSGFLGMRG